MEDLKEKADEIKTTIIGGIRDWAIMQIVKKASLKLLMMLNPAGALVQAVMLIYDTVMFFVTNWNRIIDFVGSIFSSISKIAAGKVGAAAAGFIENAMALTIPMMMSFLARFVGLGGIGKAIKKVINKVRKPIDKAITKIIKKVAGKIRKWFGGGKKGKKKKEDKDKDKEEAKFANESFTMSGKSHTLKFKKGKVYMASKEGVLTSKLVKAKTTVEKSQDSPEWKGNSGHIINSLSGLERATSSTTSKLNAAKNPNDPKKEKKAQSSLDKLAINIGKFGNKHKLKDLIKGGKDDKPENKFKAIDLGNGMFKGRFENFPSWSGYPNPVTVHPANKFIGYKAMSNVPKPNGKYVVSGKGTKGAPKSFVAEWRNYLDNKKARYKEILKNKNPDWKPKQIENTAKARVEKEFPGWKGQYHK